MSMGRRLRLFLPVLGLVLVLDQLTKAWARAALAGGPWPSAGASFRLELRWNTGIAFSLLRTANAGMVLAIFALAVAVGLCVWAARAKDVASRALVGVAMIAAGAAGNAIDRLAMGKVTDFAVVEIGSFSWPAFNVADAALVIGVLLVVFTKKIARPSHAG